MRGRSERNPRNPRAAAVLSAVAWCIATTGCGVKPPDRVATAPAIQEAAGKGAGATQPAAPSAELNPHVQAEADEPSAHGSAIAQPASPAGSSTKPGKGSVNQPKPVAGNATTKNPLLGAARTSLATGSGSLPAALLADKLELRDGSGAKVYSFKNKGADAVKFYDAAGQELCKLTVSTDKLKAKTPDDKPLFELKHKDDKTSLRLPPDEQEVWKLKPRGDRLEIHSHDDRLTYVVRREGAAMVLERQSGELVCRAERKGGSTTVTNAAGKSVISSAAIDDPLALIFFGWTELDPSQQAACLVFYLRKNPS